MVILDNSEDISLLPQAIDTNPNHELPSIEVTNEELLVLDEHDFVVHTEQEDIFPGRKYFIVGMLGSLQAVILFIVRQDISLHGWKCLYFEFEKSHF